VSSFESFPIPPIFFFMPHVAQYRLCNPPPAVGKVRSCSGMYSSTVSLAAVAHACYKSRPLRTSDLTMSSIGSIYLLSVCIRFLPTHPLVLTSE
jgi:hypothetical protein